MSTRLAIINDRVKGHSRTFNVMSKKVFDNIIEGGVSRERLRAMFMPLEEPKIEQITDEVERTIKHAIDMASTDEPNLVTIMTSDARRKDYEENEHYKKSLNLVRLASGDKCVDIINFFYGKVERTD